MRTLNGKELRFASKKGLKVYYKEIYYNPMEDDYEGECIMEKAKNGYYIGNSDIDPNDFTDDELVYYEFSGGFVSVHEVKGVKYLE